MGVRLAACALLFGCASGCTSGCSGTKSRPVEDAKHPALAPADDAARADAATTAAPKAPSATTGDVSVRVEWETVPATVRASPGTTPCGTPRRPQVAPSTTWGIGDVLVIVDGAPAAGAPSAAHVRLEDCALVPRIAIGGSLVVDSAADRPTKLVIAERSLTADLDAKREESTPKRSLLLPIAGHAVTLPLDAGAVYEITTEGKDPETAWIVAATAAVTDPGGVVLVKDVAVGVHAVRAWLPPRAGQPARHAAGTVTVAAGDLAELTLQLVP